MRSTIHITLVGDDEPVLSAILAEQAKAKSSFEFSYGAITPASDVVILGATMPLPHDYHGVALRIVHPHDTPIDTLPTFYKPIKLAQVLDAAMSGAMLHRLKSPRVLNGAHAINAVFKPFARVIDNEDGKSIQLTEKESCFLCAILDAGAHGLARITAVTQLWGYHPDAQSHAVDTTLYRLRQKLQLLAMDQHLINDNGVYKWVDS